MADIQVETPPAPLPKAPVEGTPSQASVPETGIAPATATATVPAPETVPQTETAPETPPAPPPPKAVTKKEAENKKETKEAKEEVSLNGLMESLQNSIIAGNIPQIVLHMITYATNIGASDIHIEPLENMVRIRFRVDGVLRLIIEYPSNIHPAVISRVKIMSGLKIDEQRIPQDGRMQITTEDNRELDLRVSTLPTVNGEKIVSRIQDKSKTIPDLPDLGIQGENMKKMERFLKLPNGVLLVTGPTGSGKTNTLYSTLSRLNVIGVNIMTFEDPVEYQMDGLSQSQMKPEIKYDFASGLRTALRQDPDIIMVGEIRDQETIEIAIRAALTGHLVLSTVHTNSAVGTLTRIADMGLPGYLTASAIRGIIAQRLVRHVCPDCKELYTPEPELLAEIKKELDIIPKELFDHKLLENPQLARGKGCEKCGDTGNKGRMGIFEVMEMDRDIGALILKNATDKELMEQAMKNGMISLKQDGYIKALQGDIPIEEVYRVVQ